MYINTYKFGQTLRNLRHRFNYTQKDVTLLLSMDGTTPGLSTETLRRIEGGKVVPSFETLELLSTVYKQDLNALFLEYRMNNYQLFINIQKNIDNILNSNKYDELSFELKKLKNINCKFISHYHKDLIIQYILFTEAMLLHKRQKDNNQALSKLIKAMTITTYTFNLSNYQLYKYSPMEIRILMNIALILNRLDYKKEYKKVLKFCIENMKPRDKLFPKVCHNLAGAYRRDEEFNKSIIFSDLAIESAITNNHLNELNILYYGKGIAEYKLNKKDYQATLNKSIVLSKAFKQDNVTKTIITNCKDVFNISLLYSLIILFSYYLLL